MQTSLLSTQAGGIGSQTGRDLTSNPLPLRGDHQWEACAWQLGCCFSHVVHALQWKSVRPANSFSTEAKLTWLEDAVIHC